MARRTKPDPLAAKIGSRVRRLREAEGLTMEQLAYSCDFSKGQLSTIERGLAVPSATTLAVLAEGLGVLPLDLLTFPGDGDRQRLIDVSRGLSTTETRAILKRIEKA